MYTETLLVITFSLFELLLVQSVLLATYQTSWASQPQHTQPCLILDLQELEKIILRSHCAIQPIHQLF